MKAIHRYVAFIVLLALLAILLVDWSQLAFLTTAHWLGFLALIALGLVSESLAFVITVEETPVNTSITFLPVLTSAILFGPEAGVLCAGLAGAAGEVLRKKTPFRAVFNVAQWVVATAVAGVVFTALGGEGVAIAGAVGSDAGLTEQFGPLFSYALAFLLLNHAAVSLAIALDGSVPFVQVWKRIVGPSAGNILYDLLISPIAIAVAFFYVSLGLVGILVALLPLLFVRHSYLTNLQLQRANRDLLKALIKAIETRDPYTSGHSLRVSSLAKRIAQEMNVSSRKTDAIETAALLHDIGKIDPIYTEILKKPDNLTSAEREVIQSHVVKGVEIIESLSSFGSDVIQAVRHHHERIDGKGYPDGLEGEEIPLGGRIIKVCDAVDAMLSDRPYRRALQISAVKEQLLMYSGSQFDEVIVERIISADLLEQHAREVRLINTELRESHAVSRRARGTAQAAVGS